MLFLKGSAHCLYSTKSARTERQMLFFEHLCNDCRTLKAVIFLQLKANIRNKKKHAPTCLKYVKAFKL